MSIHIPGNFIHIVFYCLIEYKPSLKWIQTNKKENTQFNTFSNVEKKEKRKKEITRFPKLKKEKREEKKRKKGAMWFIVLSA